MTTAYFDCFAGASGDMVLGALVDAGLALDDLRAALASLPLSGYRIEAVRDKRGPLTGTRLSVVLTGNAGDQPHRTLADVEGVLRDSALPQAVVDQAVAVFTRLAEAEAQVHGVDVHEVHFHEVGAVDALVDVAGSLLGLRLLGADRVTCSALPGGTGFVKSQHGLLPLPAPATMALMARAQAPMRSVPATQQPLGELVTPTAAAILTTVAEFRQPAGTIAKVAYGIGQRDHPELPNALRLWLCEEAPASPGGPTGEVQLLETNIDDMNPELYGYVAEQLFAQGALDVWYSPIQMKKGRPGVLLGVLCRPSTASQLAALLLRETSTLGVRTCTMARWEADRETVAFASSLGPAAVKVKRLGGEVVHVAPEYDVCRDLALRHGLPLHEVYRRLSQEAWSQLAAGLPQAP